MNYRVRRIALTTGSALLVLSMAGAAWGAVYTLSASVPINQDGVVGSIDPVSDISGTILPVPNQDGSIDVVNNDVFVVDVTLSGGSDSIDQLGITVGSLFPFHPTGAGAFDDAGRQAPTTVTADLLNLAGRFTFAGNTVDGGETTARLFVTYAPSLEHPIATGQTVSFVIGSQLDFTVQGIVEAVPNGAASLGGGLLALALALAPARRSRRALVGLVAGLAMVAGSSPAHAAPDNAGTTLVGEPHGFVSFCLQPCYTVEHSFEVFLDGNPTSPGVCPAGDNTYLYTITHLGGAGPYVPGLTRFKLGLSSGSISSISSAGFIPSPGVSPSSVAIDATFEVVTWEFLATSISTGQTSTPLFLCSSQLPGTFLDTGISVLGSASLAAQGTTVGPAVPTQSIALAPELSLNEPGQNHTVTAVLTQNDTPVEGTQVSFTVLSGPNAASSGDCTFNVDCTTDVSGMVFFTYTGSGGSGVDEIAASFVDSEGATVDSNTVLKFWDADCNQNDVPDTCDLACGGFGGACDAFAECGGSSDGNGDGVPDDCNNPPDCDGAGAEPEDLWPPNGAFRDVAIAGVTDEDGDPVSVTITAIFQDEPVQGQGDGTSSPDAAGVGMATAQIRAERSGTPEQPGDGRVYHVSFDADDGTGGTCSGEVTVCVPHDKRPASQCVDEGALFDSTDPGPAGPQGRGRCGLGFELAFLLPALVWLNRRRRSVPA